MWASMAYTASSMAPAMTPERMMPLTTAPSSSTPLALILTAMTMPKARAAMVSMVW